MDNCQIETMMVVELDLSHQYIDQIQVHTFLHTHICK